MDEFAPRIVVVQAQREREGAPGRWFFVWEVRNRSGGPITLLSARLPHGRFFSEERVFHPSPMIAPERSSEIAFSVWCDGVACEFIENAFIILKVMFGEALWRVFVRFTVKLNENGEPDTLTETITAQRVGFSMEVQGID